MDASFTPLGILGGNVVGYKNYSRGLPDEAVFLGVCFWSNHCQGWASIGRGDGGPASAGEFHVGNQGEAKLVYVELEATVLVTDKDGDVVQAQVRGTCRA